MGWVWQVAPFPGPSLKGLGMRLRMHWWGNSEPPSLEPKLLPSLIPFACFQSSEAVWDKVVSFTTPDLHHRCIWVFPVCNRENTWPHGMWRSCFLFTCLCHGNYTTGSLRKRLGTCGIWNMYWQLYCSFVQLLLPSRRCIHDTTMCRNSIGISSVSCFVYELGVVTHPTLLFQWAVVPHPVVLVVGESMHGTWEQLTNHTHLSSRWRCYRLVIA